jgi:hypothetical protein
MKHSYEKDTGRTGRGYGRRQTKWLPRRMVSSGMLPFFIVTAVKTSNLTNWLPIELKWALALISIQL